MGTARIFELPDHEHRSGISMSWRDDVLPALLGRVKPERLLHRSGMAADPHQIDR